MYDIQALSCLAGAVACCAVFCWIEYRLVFLSEKIEEEGAKKLHRLSKWILFGIVAFLLMFFWTLL